MIANQTIHYQSRQWCRQLQNTYMYRLCIVFLSLPQSSIICNITPGSQHPVLPCIDFIDAVFFVYWLLINDVFFFYFVVIFSLKCSLTSLLVWLSNDYDLSTAEESCVDSSSVRRHRFETCYVLLVYLLIINIVCSWFVVNIALKF